MTPCAPKTREARLHLPRLFFRSLRNFVNLDQRLAGSGAGGRGLRGVRAGAQVKQERCVSAAGTQRETTGLRREGGDVGGVGVIAPIIVGADHSLTGIERYARIAVCAAHAERAEGRADDAHQNRFAAARDDETRSHRLIRGDRAARGHVDERRFLHACQHIDVGIAGEEAGGHFTEGNVAFGLESGSERVAVGGCVAARQRQGNRATGSERAHAEIIGGRGLGSDRPHQHLPAREHLKQRRYGVGRCGAVPEFVQRTEIRAADAGLPSGGTFARRRKRLPQECPRDRVALHADRHLPVTVGGKGRGAVRADGAVTFFGAAGKILEPDRRAVAAGGDEEIGITDSPEIIALAALLGAGGSTEGQGGQRQDEKPNDDHGTLTVAALGGKIARAQDETRWLGCF